MDNARFPQPGDVFAGRYRLEALLGKGGFARVFRATQLDLGREVAIKVLSRGVLNDGGRTLDRRETRDASRRFRREAKLVSQLRDPHTVTIYDYGESDDGLLYIVLELIEGQSLKEVIYSEGPLEPKRVVDILCKLLSSLREAHKLGILHRDIKPSNVMVFDHMGREEVKLLDFGVAKLGNRGRVFDSSSVISELTKEGSLVGTPRYMAPEQITDKQVAPPSDLFSLGLVAYEMLTRTQANPNRSGVAVLGRQLDDEPFVLPSSPDIPAGLRKVVHGMIRKNPAERYQSATEVLKALTGWNVHADELAPTFEYIPLSRRNSVDRDVEPVPSPPGDAVPREEISESPVSSKVVGTMVMLIVLGLCVGAAAFYAFGPSDLLRGQMIDRDPSEAEDAPASPPRDESGKSDYERSTLAAPSAEGGGTPEPEADPEVVSGNETPDSPAPAEAGTVETIEDDDAREGARKKVRRRNRRGASDGRGSSEEGSIEPSALDEKQNGVVQPPPKKTAEPEATTQPEEPSFFGLDEAE